MEQTLYITQNSPFIQDVRVFANTGAPADLTGYTAKMLISKYYGSLTKYNVSTNIIDPTNGVVRASISSTGTGSIPYGTMRYSLYLIPPVGDQFLIVQGVAVIIPTV